MRLYFAAIILIAISFSATAQEYNFGVHVNPAFCSPVFDSKSVYDSRLNVSGLRFTYNAGADINIVFKKWRIETGLNYVNKAIVFGQNTHNISGIAYSRDIVNSNSYEVPVLLGYKLLTRDKKTFYHLYGVAGVSYEFSNVTGMASRTGAQGNGSINVTGHTISWPSGVQQSVNIIAGFHINAIVHKLGLIDYGISYHFPFNTRTPGISDAYIASTTVSSGGGTAIYKGTFYSHMSYINLKIAYYFLNLDERMRRKQYHKL